MGCGGEDCLERGVLRLWLAVRVRGMQIGVELCRRRGLREARRERLLDRVRLLGRRLEARLLLDWGSLQGRGRERAFEKVGCDG